MVTGSRRARTARTSCGVSCAITRSSSSRRKSDSVSPCAAARAFSWRCSRSGTWRIWIILDMREACRPVGHMPTTHCRLAGLGESLRGRHGPVPSRVGAQWLCNEAATATDSARFFCAAPPDHVSQRRAIQFHGDADPVAAGVGAASSPTFRASSRLVPMSADSSACPRTTRSCSRHRTGSIPGEGGQGRAAATIRSPSRGRRGPHDCSCEAIP
jgi:hypothetical protein